MPRANGRQSEHPGKGACRVANLELAQKPLLIVSIRTCERVVNAARDREHVRQQDKMSDSWAGSA